MYGKLRNTGLLRCLNDLLGTASGDFPSTPHSMFRKATYMVDAFA